jgi:hypothetical protein
MSSKALWLIPVILASVVLAATVVAHNPRYTPDGFSYARKAMEDAGLTPAESLARAEAFYLAQPVGRVARYGIYFKVDAAHAPPAAGPIFRTRVLYPWLVSLLFPWRGLAALSDVSLAAYVIATLMLYWMLLAIARPWLAATGAIVFAASPLVVVLGESDLTDMLALACWIGALAAILHCLQVRTTAVLAIFGVSALLLALTRQALLLPIGAVAGAFVGSRIRHDDQDTRTSVVLASILGVVTIANVVWHVLLHGVGIGTSLEVTRDLQVKAGAAPADEPIQTWYRRTLISSLVDEVKRSIRGVLPVLAVIAAVIDIRRKETAVLIGAACAGFVTIFADAVSWDLQRIFEAPLYPVVLAALSMGVERLLRARMSAEPSPAAS